MPNFSQATVMGHLGRDPEVKFVGSNAVCSFSVAVNDPMKKEDPPTWWNVSIWGKRGEKAGEMLSKGTAVLVTGRPKMRTYEKKTGGQGYSLELNANEWTFAGSKGDSAAPVSGGGRHDYGPPPMTDDEVPF